jgi:hypothetical protein
VPQVSLVLRDLGVATSAASVMGIALFLRHFGSRVVDVVLAQVSQQQRDMGHPASSSVASARFGNFPNSFRLWITFVPCANLYLLFAQRFGHT